MSGAYEFDPDSVYRAQEQLYKAVIRMNQVVEQPLRRVELPEMPPPVRGTATSTIAGAVATMAAARVGLAQLARHMKDKTYDLVAHPEPMAPSAVAFWAAYVRFCKFTGPVEQIVTLSSKVLKGLTKAEDLLYRRAQKAVFDGLNAKNVDLLADLKGVSKQGAKELVQRVTAHGPVSSLDELDDVMRGWGRRREALKVFERMLDAVERPKVPGKDKLAAAVSRVKSFPKVEDASAAVVAVGKVVTVVGAPFAAWDAWDEWRDKGHNNRKLPGPDWVENSVLTVGAVAAGVGAGAVVVGAVTAAAPAVAVVGTVAAAVGLGVTVYQQGPTVVRGVKNVSGKAEDAAKKAWKWMT